MVIPNVILERVTTKEGFEEFFTLEEKLAGPTFKPTPRTADVSKDRSIYFIKIGEQRVGHISYKDQPGNTVYLDALAVEPDFHGKGIGREAMKLFLQKVSNASKIWLVTHPDNTAAVNLYLSLGFEITERKENYFGNGTPRVVMVLKK